jgi:aspartyl-tRNA(Asn)/glutamyl-tRNA(Gln) amidotransferase subunit A
MDRGGLSAVELMQAVISRTKEVDGRVGAFNSFDEGDALAQARASDERRSRAKAAGADAAARPLEGIPIGMKDVISVAGQPLTASSRMLEHFVSPYDATVTQKLKDAGAVCWGRLNLDEFAMGSSTENSAFRTTSNPWDLERVPGGSSGGSAAAVAAGVGMKPSYGRVSRYGLIAFASSLDQIGPFSRSVEDAASVLGVISGHDRRDSTSVNLEVPDYNRGRAALAKSGRIWKLGIPKEYFGEGLDSEVGAAVQAAIEVYRQLGAEIHEVSLPHTKYAVGTYYIIATAECSSNLARFDGVRYGHRSKSATDALGLYFKSRAEGFGPEVKRRIILGTYVLSSGYYDAFYLRAQKVRTLIRRDFLEAYRHVDAIVTPTSPTPAFQKGEKAASPLAMYLNDIYTIGVNLAGLPGISLPCGFTRAGLPIGLQVIGQPFKETELLSIAGAYEERTDWRTRRPSL